METVMRTLTRKSSNPVRAGVQGTRDPRVEVELRDLKADQRHLLKLLQQLGRPKQVSMGSSRGGGAERQRPSATVTDRNSAKGGTGDIAERDERQSRCVFVVGERGTLSGTVTSPNLRRRPRGEHLRGIGRC